jgi:DNA ligase (NAD+)
VGLGVRHLGPTGSRALARATGSLDALMAASVDELAVVEGIGPVIADSVVEFLVSPANRNVVDKLRAAAVDPGEPGARPRGGAGTSGAAGAEGTPGARGDIDVGAADDAGDGPEQTLAGRSVVVTGTLEGYTREEAEEAILVRGGKSPGSVSAKTWAVVLGAEPGAAKLKKAEELGIPVIAGDRFAALLETGELPGP